jgi:hypothetical protein
MGTPIVTPEVHAASLAAVAEIVATAPVEVVPVAPVPEVKWHEYQPVDEHHRPVGGKQRFSYTTMEELVQKLESAHSNSILGMRDVKRKARLGTPEVDALPAELELISPTIQFKEKTLTTEERYSISQDMNDPAKFESARDRLFESSLGVPPAQLRDTLNTQQTRTLQIMARQNAEVWLERHPEFYGCTENINTVCEWMTKTGLHPSVRNYEFAQAKMEEAGLLLSSPIVREVLPETPQPQVEVPVVERVQEPQSPVPEPVRINEVPVPQEKRQSHVPSGLNNRVAPVGGAMTVSAMETLTLKKIDDMPSEDYRKQIMTNPAFVQRVNELEATRPPRPRR